MKSQLFFLLVMSTSLVATQAFAADRRRLWRMDLTLETQAGPRPSWVKLFVEEDVPVAEFVGTGGGKNRAHDVRVDGDTFQWTIAAVTYHATLSDGKLTGHMVEGDRRTPLTGERVVRQTNVSGTWDVQVDLADRTLQRELKLQQQGDQITGTVSGGGLPDRTLKRTTLDGDRLAFAIEYSNDDRSFTVEYAVVVHGDRLAGTAAVRDSDRRGDVKATRRRSWQEPIELIGNDLSNWDFQQVGGENRWKVADGVLVNEGRGWNIFSKDRFKNYRLRIDVKVPRRGNSGIYLNGRYEVQVADSFGRNASEGGMGAIYGRAVPTANPSRPADEWQTFEITFVDYWATVALNGTTIIDNVLIEGITGGALDSHESQPGPIMLQGDHGPIEYRKIVVTPLAEEGPEQNGTSQ